MCKKKKKKPELNLHTGTRKILGTGVGCLITAVLESSNFAFKHLKYSPFSKVIDAKSHASLIS